MSRLEGNYFQGKYQVTGDICYKQARVDWPKETSVWQNFFAIPIFFIQNLIFFFQYQICSIPNPILFAIKLSWYQIFPIPNPLLFILIFFKTESDTFFYINFFYTESDTFLIPNIFDTESDTIKKIESFWNREVSNLDVTLWKRLFFDDKKFSLDLQLMIPWRAWIGPRCPFFTNTKSCLDWTAIIFKGSFRSLVT